MRLMGPPSSVTHERIANLDSVRIAFLVYARNEHDVLDGDIQNTFLNAPTKEKLYFYTAEE